MVKLKTEAFDGTFVGDGRGWYFVTVYVVFAAVIPTTVDIVAAVPKPKVVPPLSLRDRRRAGWHSA